MGQKVKSSPRELFKTGIILIYTEVTFRREVPCFGVLETWDQIPTQTIAHWCLCLISGRMAWVTVSGSPQGQSVANRALLHRAQHLVIQKAVHTLVQHRALNLTDLEKCPRSGSSYKNIIGIWLQQSVSKHRSGWESDHSACLARVWWRISSCFLAHSIVSR